MATRVNLGEVLVDWGGIEVSAMTVYSDMFRLGENFIQRKGEPGGDFKGNPIGYFKESGASKGHFRIFFDDTFEETLQELQAADFAILGGLTYFGRRNVMEHANKMHAMIFDLDGVNEMTLTAFLSGAIGADVYPLPNYIILSGNGVHLYYIFDEPISLYPNIKLQLKDLKYALIEKMWNPYTSTIKKRQYQGINQGFRPIGGRTKIAGVSVRAFKFNSERVSLETLGRYVADEYRVNTNKIWKESKVTLAEAKRRWPEWYQRVVVEGNSEPRYWDLGEKVHGSNRYAIYDWWIGKIKEGAVYGHRYYAIMCLAIYAAKCRQSYEQLEKDALALVPFLNDINPKMPFTEDDVMSALECYDSRYNRFPREDMEKLSSIDIPKNKRNGRKQRDHCAIVMVRAKETKRMLGELKRDGRPNLRKKVLAYRAEHPEVMNKSQVARDLGISQKTVSKWWDSEPENE